MPHSADLACGMRDRERLTQTAEVDGGTADRTCTGCEDCTGDDRNLPIVRLPSSCFLVSSHRASRGESDWTIHEVYRSEPVTL